MVHGYVLGLRIRVYGFKISCHAQILKFGFRLESRHQCLNINPQTTKLLNHEPQTLYPANVKTPLIGLSLSPGPPSHYPRPSSVNADSKIGTVRF